MEVGAGLTEDVVVAQVGWPPVWPAERRRDVDVDVDGDTVWYSAALGPARVDVGHSERVGRSERVSVLHH